MSGTEAIEGWGTVGKSFDDMSFSMSDALVHAAQRLNPRFGQIVIDIGTGTGTSARNAARFGARVVGVDPAPALLEAAKDLSKHVAPAIDYRVGAAESLPCESACFDSAISTFGIMFSSEPKRAATEAARVLKPRGRLILANWVPDDAVTMTFALLAKYDPRHTDSVEGGASPLDWGVPEYVSELLSGAFELIFERGVNTVYFDSAEDMYDFYARCFGPLQELIGLVDVDAQQALRREFIDIHARYAVPGGIAVSRPYLIVKGVRSDSRNG